MRMGKRKPVPRTDLDFGSHTGFRDKRGVAQDVGGCVFEFSTCFPADELFVDVSMRRDLIRALLNERPLEGKALPPGAHFLEEAVHEVIRSVTLRQGQVAQQALGTGGTYHV